MLLLPALLLLLVLDLISISIDIWGCLNSGGFSLMHLLSVRQLGLGEKNFLPNYTAA